MENDSNDQTTTETAQSYLMLCEDPQTGKVFAIHHDFTIERFQSVAEIGDALAGLDGFAQLVFAMALEIERLRQALPETAVN